MTKALELAKFGRETPPTGAVVGDTDTQTLSSKTFSDGPVFSGNAINGVPYLNASKVFSTSSTFVFDGTNLGIGVANPAQRLDVNGTVKIGSGSGETLTLGSLDLGKDIGLADGYGIVTGNARVLTFRTSGNVGLGTASPAYKLEIATGTSGQQSLAGFRTADATAANNAGLMVFATPSATATSRSVVAVWDADGANSSGGDYFLINKNGNSGTVDILQYSNAAMRFGANYIGRASIDMIITGAGNVGIGIDSPLAKLDIAASSSGITWNIKSTNTNNPNASGQGTGIQLGMSTSGDALYKWAGIAAVAEAIYSNTLGLAFYTQADQSGGGANPTTNPTEKMRLTKDGWLGVGTPSPATRIDVRGTSNTAASTFQIVGTNTSTLLLGQNADGGVIRGQGGNNALTFWTGGNADTGAGLSGTERMRISANGDVQITSTSNLGGGKLDITSNATAIIQARSTTTGTGDGTADVTVIRAVTAGASWWANARYDAFSHTWGYSGSATAVIGMRLNGAGNLGIGTTGNTTQKLNVNGAVWLLGNDDANYSTIIEPRYDSSQPFAIRTRNNDSTMVNWLNIYADGGGSNNRIVLGAGGWNVNIGDTGSTGGYKLKVNGTLGVTGPAVISSYASVGSIVANDPGAGYYSYNNRIGGALAVVGTLYNVGTTYANKFTLNQGSTGPTRTAGTVAAGWYRFARSGDSGAGGFGSRGGCTFYMYTTGGWSGPGQTKIELFKDYSTTVNLTVDSKGTYYFTNWRLAMDSNYAYLEGWTNGFNFGGDNTFNTILDSYGWDAGGWTLYTEPLTAGLSSPSGVVRASHINLNGRTMERNIASSANEPDDFVTVNGISWASAFDNPVMDLFTFPTPTTIYPNLIAEVEVWQTPWSNVSTGNAHVGYANYGSQGSIKNVTTMTMKNTMPSGSHGNVGTLSWSGNTLRYTSNRASNYDHYNLKFTVRHQEIHNIQYFT